MDGTGIFACDHDRDVGRTIGPGSWQAKKRGEIESSLQVDDKTLAGILIKGMEAIIHDGNDNGMEVYDSEGLRERLMEFCERIIVTR